MERDIVNAASLLQKEIDQGDGTINRKKTSPQTAHDFFDSLITDKQLRKTTERLYRDGHHARAVEEAYKFIDNLVKKHAKHPDQSLTGSKLMTNVFGVSSPFLKINSGTSTSEKDEQVGYMQILSGCMTGIRNPRAHECDWEDSETRAMQLLIWANHLVERIRLSEHIPQT